MSSLAFIESATACLANGQRLLDDADWLNHEKHAATSLALVIIAEEEFAKAFLLFLASRGVIAWNSLIYRATRDHTCKQLLGLVMAYIRPDTDESFRRMEDWLAVNEERKKLFEAYKSSSNAIEKEAIWERIQQIRQLENALPKSIADAINIFRHEKVGQWESPRRVCTHGSDYDEIAKCLSGGKRDREKQDALYVRFNREGQVVTTPDQIMNEEIAPALENAARLASLIKSLLSGDVHGFDYEKIETAFKTAFADLSETETSRVDES